MSNRNMSDIIEAYLKEVLQDTERVEIRRSEIADRFECVPSQINYVINTRFTPKQGYQVESKRGGGGYIRIMKLNIIDDADYIDNMISLVGNDISLRDAVSILTNLMKNELLNESEAAIMHSAIDKQVMSNFKSPDRVRAVILRNMLEHLKYH
ncbi:CtsR family transcriptional regulator [Aerococcus urinae]|uniref:Transcriptional regulator CtsR n=1 Tax=Aerococcus mictus TaxID=2976810 RepID=A0A1E9PIK9_9LACT|nr:MULTISPECIES: CtsR family transcriptional regulator [Aerococcus]KAA9293186.1 CtsR family transcriptional regulator [Aerococcus mictus]MCY3034676.1 CtsR family transcriptional regulator [Aerococcus mictus]MCY3036757.1 CtsR family transcriptional regulator [Aerococcus sp. Group 2]MCY3039974.1 CtsR family transcriptional regulator [Aerococcus sp. Group 2]MCY3041780.1 CtsR family transcriptional regulator [Aerococcus sp. Group 2]